jgi:hypothetical protein
MMVKSRRKQGLKVVERGCLKVTFTFSGQNVGNFTVLFRSFQEINKFLGNCELIRQMRMPGTACFLLKHSKNNALWLPNDSEERERGERNCRFHLMSQRGLQLLAHVRKSAP